VFTYWVEFINASSGSQSLWLFSLYECVFFIGFTEASTGLEKGGDA